MQDAQDAARGLEGAIAADLEKKMVMLSGPRQAGKTTLARRLLASFGGEYFNWDVASHRKALRESRLPEGARMWVFDELHKLRTWRNWLKGVYDLHGRQHPILVTGSARLELYARGGDSLQGRYFAHRLHPFTLAELLGIPALDDVDAIPRLDASPPAGANDALASLRRLGGFPEPLFAGSDRHAARWRSSYGTRVVREDVRDLERISDLDKLELLFDRLPDTVGSPLSINALREDLEVAFGTARTWLLALERLYAFFRIPPLGTPRIRAVKKEQKLYLWDWARVAADGPRFENLLVSHLLRLVHWLEDIHGEPAELRYFRSVDGHEVDAIVLRRGKPWMAVEAKVSDGPLDRGLRYLLERVRIPYAFQVSLTGSTDTRLPDINGAKVRLVPATRFLASLPLRGQWASRQLGPAGAAVPFSRVWLARPSSFARCSAPRSAWRRSRCSPCPRRTRARRSTPRTRWSRRTTRRCASCAWTRASRSRRRTRPPRT